MKTKKVVKAYMSYNKSIPQLAVEFNITKSSVSKWDNGYKKEYLYTTSATAKSNEAKEIRRLNQLMNEKDKNILDLRWLYVKFGISPNRYYNYKKEAKLKYHEHLAHIFELIKYVYYNNNRVIGIGLCAFLLSVIDMK